MLGYFGLICILYHHVQIQAMPSYVNPLTLLRRTRGGTWILLFNQNTSGGSRPCFYVLIFLLIVVGFFYSFLFKEKYDLRHFALRIRPNLLVKLYPACPIPQLDPWDKSLHRYLSEKPPDVDCESKFPLLFNSTLDSTIVPAKGEDYFKQKDIESCHYRILTRSTESDNPDDNVNISSEAYPLSLSNATVIPPEHEFIAIYCKQYGNSNETMMDVHAFVPLKGLKNKTTETTGKPEGKRKWNVLIFGMDALSRMNFLRTMPNSFSFLKDELGAVEMFGYNKVAENTFLNIMPMLTSYKPIELVCPRKSNKSDYNCPFIWKEYSKEGYFTSFAEDSPSSSRFNYASSGFKKQPTDYYPRAMMRFAGENIFSYYQWTASLCYGPRLTFQIVLDYVKKFLHRMSDTTKPFFQFAWTSALTHDRLTTGLLGDQYLLQFLKWLKQSGHLENTVFIVMSDHGNRMSKIRNSVQGSLEDRLPLLYVVLPDDFKKQYRLHHNLLKNSDKLVTTFDIHETLQDILHSENIEDSSLSGMNVSQNSGEGNSSLPRGISLFRPVPGYRTCAMAGVENNFCSCNYLTLVSVEQPGLKDVARTAVTQINSQLANNSRCAQLQLDQVTFARSAGRLEYHWEAYLINFLTLPGGAQFEALVSRKQKADPWKVEGSVTRTNIYMNQSRCISDVKLKPYCYCAEL